MMKIVEAELPRDDLPQMLQMDLKYFPGIRFDRYGDPVFKHIIAWQCLPRFFQNVWYDDEGIDWDDPFPEALRDQWTRDLTAADLQNKMYIQLLDSQRLYNLVLTLVGFEYDSYEFMEEMIAEILSRIIAIPSKEHFLQRVFLDCIHLDGKHDVARILRLLEHRTDEETMMRVRNKMFDTILPRRYRRYIVESDDDDDDDDE